MHRPLRVATMGTGYFSRFHYRAWRRIPEVRFVGVCDLTLDRAKGVVDEFGIEGAYDDLGRMLKSARPYLLDIITPPQTHLSAIRLAAASGVNVICQKPFCRDLSEAQAAVALAERSGIHLVVHENFRFQPWHREIARLLDERRLGEVYQATFRLRPGDGQGPRAYLDRQPYFQQMPRFLVHETAIHLIDVFRYLLGEVATVYADLRKLNPVIAGEDAGLIVLGMTNGSRAVFDGNRLVDHRAGSPRLTMGEMLIEGAHGTLRLDGDGRVFVRNHGSGVETAIDYTWRNEDFGGDCVYELQRHAVDALLGRRVFTNAGRDYLANLRVEEAAYASSEEGRRIDLRQDGIGIS